MSCMHCDNEMNREEPSRSNDFPNHVQYTVVEVDSYSLCNLLLQLLIIVQFLVMSSHVD